MRQAWVTEGINEAAIVAEAKKAGTATFIHLHAYDAECESSCACYLVVPKEWGTDGS